VVKRGDDARVRLANKQDSLVGRRDLPQQLRAWLRRTVVDDDHAQVYHRLCQQAGHRLADRRRAVVDGEKDVTSGSHTLSRLARESSCHQ
jgi:hypothetical protein